MLPFMSNKADLGNALAEQLDTLPRGWVSTFSAKGPPELDGTLSISSPDGLAKNFLIEYKRRFDPRDVDQIERLSARYAHTGRMLVVAPHLSTRSRELLRERGLSYADLTGNLWLSNDSLLVERVGAGKDPGPAMKGQRSSLRGPVTGRIVRLLCDVRPPLKVREIATRANVHPGNVSRLLSLLDRDRLIARDADGAVADVDWEPLIRRWSTDLAKDRESAAFLEPRGLDLVTSRLRESALRYAVTGSYGSAQLAPDVVPVTIDVYVENVEAARDALKLRSSDRVGNVRLIRAFDEVVFERTVVPTNVVLAAPSQIAADLLTLPKRSRSEYEELIGWMKRHESDWRR